MRIGAKLTVALSIIVGGVTAAELKRVGYLVTVLENADATRAIVLKAVDDAKKVLAGPNATVAFFFSGHGFAQLGTNSLATHETFLEDLPATGLPLHTVQQHLDDTEAQRQVLFVDACRNDPGAAAKSAGLRSFGKLSASAGMRALFSTKAGEVSCESEELGQRVFTHFLLGLRRPGISHGRYARGYESLTWRVR